MTQAERLTLEGLNNHVIELKGDVGELKGDVRAIKDALGVNREEDRHNRSLRYTIFGALAGAASLAGLEHWLLH